MASKERVFKRWELNVTAGNTGQITLDQNDCANAQFTLLISGHAKASLSDVVNVKAKAGTTAIDLSYVSEIVYDVAGQTACIMKIDFPVLYLKIEVNAAAADINLTVVGGNF